MAPVGPATAITTSAIMSVAANTTSGMRRLPASIIAASTEST